MFENTKQTPVPGSEKAALMLIFFAIALLGVFLVICLSQILND